MENMIKYYGAYNTFNGKWATESEWIADFNDAIRYEWEDIIVAKELFKNTTAISSYHDIPSIITIVPIVNEIPDFTKAQFLKDI